MPMLRWLALQGAQAEEEDSVMMEEDAGGRHPGVADRVGSLLVPLQGELAVHPPGMHAAQGAWPGLSAAQRCFDQVEMPGSTSRAVQALAT